MFNNIVADASFYICYQDDINKREILDIFLDSYTFYIGPCILSELPALLSKNDRFQSSIKLNNEQFFELIKPFFGRSENHRNDGEYEAIGLAYHLNLHFGLKYLIIDDKRAYNFVNANFPSLKNKLTRNIGFIIKSCKKDSTISLVMAIEILESIKEYVEKVISEGTNCRPCSVDIKVCRKILIPLIGQLKEEYECS